MPSGDWQRVKRSEPCPICDHGDWCLVKRDGSAVICARIESTKRVQRPGRDQAGWLHVLRDDRPLLTRMTFAKPQPESPRPDFTRLAAGFSAALKPQQIERFAAGLGLSIDSLRRLGIGWAAEKCCWSFPMSDAAGKFIGIRLRAPNGAKFSWTGGQNGLFIPSGLLPIGNSEFHAGERLLITEGPTDCAALLDWGFPAVGRPSCTGGVPLLIDLVRRLRTAEVVIVGDVDSHGAGQRGAEHLAHELLPMSPVVRVIYPPEGIKDARAWKQAGATVGDVLAAIEAAPARRLKVTFRLEFAN